MNDSFHWIIIKDHLFKPPVLKCFTSLPWSKVNVTYRKEID